MPRNLVTAPTKYPVSLSEAKSRAIIGISDDDADIRNMIAAATTHAENHTWRAFVTQTWDIFFNHLHDEIELPLGELRSVVSVKYIDTDGATQTLATSIYDVDTNSDPGFIRLAYNQTWPTTRLVANAVTIRIECGYGGPADVPDPIKQAMLVHIGSMYRDREAEVIGAIVTQLPMSYDRILGPYRLVV